jgi:predicted RNase H-like HicB family nuclease
VKSLDYYLRLPYTVFVTPEDCTDGTVCFMARIPELPNCQSHGDTPEEALEGIEEAKQLYLSSMLEDGVEPPEPQVATGVASSSKALSAIWRVSVSQADVDDTQERDRLPISGLAAWSEI